MVDHIDSPLLTADEVAGILRIKPATVYEAAATGRIPSVRLWRGRRKSLVRFRAEDINRIIRERTSSTSTGVRCSSSRLGASVVRLVTDSAIARSSSFCCTFGALTEVMYITSTFGCRVWYIPPFPHVYPTATPTGCVSCDWVICG